jgi:four helix bundle protein
MPPEAHPRVRSYRDLTVWQRGMDLVVLSYQLTRRLPRDELYGLTSQIRRAATSVPANIAEGQGRRHTREFLHFLGVARGSLLELETHLLAAQRLKLLNEGDVTRSLELASQVSRMIAGMIRSLEKRLRHNGGRGPLATSHPPLAT